MIRKGACFNFATSAIPQKYATTFWANTLRAKVGFWVLGSGPLPWPVSSLQLSFARLAQTFYYATASGVLSFSPGLSLVAFNG